MYYIEKRIVEGKIPSSDAPIYRLPSGKIMIRVWHNNPPHYFVFNNNVKHTWKLASYIDPNGVLFHGKELKKYRICGNDTYTGRITSNILAKLQKNTKSSWINKKI